MTSSSRIQFKCMQLTFNSRNNNNNNNKQFCSIWTIAQGSKPWLNMLETQWHIYTSFWCLYMNCQMMSIHCLTFPAISILRWSVIVSISVMFCLAGIRRFIRQLEEDGHIYELYVRNMYNNIPASQHSDTTQLGDEGYCMILLPANNNNNKQNL